MPQYEPNEVAKLSGEAVTLKDPSQDLRGRDVYDRDGNQIGSVGDLYVDAEEYYVRFLDVASGGFLGIGEKHFLIPVEAVTDASEDRVTIELDQERVKGAPDVPLNPVIEPGNVRELDDYYGYQYSSGAAPDGEEIGPDTGEEELRVQRTEEELRAGTREREAGDVRVTKSVRTDRERVEVPTRREEVTVERVPAEGETSEADIGDDEVRVPVTEEEVVVEKRPVAKEEVRIRKDVVEDTEVVEEDVRREQVDVDDDTEGRAR
jgi:uncharacterized protein (TIGR02271 family)